MQQVGGCDAMPWCIGGKVGYPTLRCLHRHVIWEVNGAVVVPYICLRHISASSEGCCTRLVVFYVQICFLL